MKKRNLKSLSLNKKAISNLSPEQMKVVGGLASIGPNCTQYTHCRTGRLSRGMFCEQQDISFDYCPVG